MSTPLVITEAVRKDIERVVEFADQRRMSLHELFRRIKQNDPPGRDPNYTCFIPFGFKCVFTIEQQPVGWVRHFSISSPHPDRTPNPEAVKMLLPEFGFKTSLDEIAKAGGCWLEDRKGGKGKAINAMELL